MRTPEETATARRAARKTERGIATRKAYRKTEKAKTARKKVRDKYQRSEKGKAVMCKISERNRKRVKKEVIDHYGGKCVCCGETELLFLTIDHINNNGAEQRLKNGLKGGSSDKSYRWIIKNDFPDDLQLLCWNCNCGRARNNGVCPHVKTKST